MLFRAVARNSTQRLSLVLFSRVKQMHVFQTNLVSASEELNNSAVSQKSDLSPLVDLIAYRMEIDRRSVRCTVEIENRA